jgi:hypothetical protein
MAAIIVKHSDAFKQADVTAHNKALKKIEDVWARIGVDCGPLEVATLEDFTKDPGFYCKDKGQWKGSYDTEANARDAKAEIDYESKH